MSDYVTSYPDLSLSDEDDGNYAACIAAIAAASSYVILDDDTPPRKRLGSPNLRRERVPVEDIIKNLGDDNFKRCYRMSKNLFWHLYETLYFN